MRCGYVLPRFGEPFADRPADLVELETLGFTSLWLRDWPLALDGDHSTGFDPLIYAMFVANALEDSATELGFAAVQLGYRSPEVTAKSLISLATLSNRKIRVGMGLKGVQDIGSTWSMFMGYLTGDCDPELFARPANFPAPQVLLCSNNPAKWESTTWRAHGWLCGGLPARGIDALAESLLARALGRDVVLQLSFRVDLARDDVAMRDDAGNLTIGRRILAKLVRAYSQRGVDEIILRPPDLDPDPRQLAAVAEIVRYGG